MPLYKIGHVLSRRFGVTRESCVCVAPGQFVPVAAFTEANVALAPEAISPQPLVAIGTAPVCMNKYNGSVWGITAQKLVDNIHYVSAAAVSFARGLNDGPKIIGLLLVMQALNLQASMLAVAVAMAIGGWLNAHKVAMTMSKKISRMNDGQALTANLVTAFMVICASRFGMPVSTTHCGWLDHGHRHCQRIGRQGSRQQHFDVLVTNPANRCCNQRFSVLALCAPAIASFIIEQLEHFIQGGW